MTYTAVRRNKPRDEPSPVDQNDKRHFDDDDFNLIEVEDDDEDWLMTGDKP